MALKLTLSTLLFLLLLSACSENEEKLQEVEISSEARTEKLMKMLVDGTERERVLARSYYDKMDASFKANTTFSEYYATLNRKYKRVLDQLNHDFLNLDKDIDPDLQISELRSKLMDAENIPVWYQDYRTRHKEKLFEAAMAKDF